MLDSNRNKFKNLLPYPPFFARTLFRQPGTCTPERMIRLAGGAAARSSLSSEEDEEAPERTAAVPDPGAGLRHWTHAEWEAAIRMFVQGSLECDSSFQVVDSKTTAFHGNSDDEVFFIFRPARKDTLRCQSVFKTREPQKRLHPGIRRESPDPELRESASSGSRLSRHRKMQNKRDPLRPHLSLHSSWNAPRSISPCNRNACPG